PKAHHDRLARIERAIGGIASLLDKRGVEANQEWRVGQRRERVNERLALGRPQARAQIVARHREEYCWSARVGVVARRNVVKRRSVVRGLCEGVNRRIDETGRWLPHAGGLLIYQRQETRPQGSGDTCAPDSKLDAAVRPYHD